MPREEISVRLGRQDLRGVLKRLRIFPRLSSRYLDYDSARNRLILRERISEEEMKMLLQLSPNEEYQRAIVSLFLMCHAIGIHMILRNRAGTFANVLADLSGLSFREDDAFIQGNRINTFPSFHYSRYQNCAFGQRCLERYFYLTADITLENDRIRPTKDAEKGTVLLSLPDRTNINRMRSELTVNLPILVPERDGTDWDRMIQAIITELLHFRHNVTPRRLLRDQCIFQLTTSPETFRPKVFNILENWRFYCSFDQEEARAEIRRASIDTSFRYKPTRDEMEGDNRITRRPLAKLFLCCRYGDTPGALAAAINRLLFRRLSTDDQVNVDYVFNIMFLIDYFSYSPSVAYDAVYGRLVRQNQLCGKRYGRDDVIERILICPVSDPENPRNSWSRYAYNLYRFLQQSSDKAYRIRPFNLRRNNGYVDNPPNILIYRRNRQPCYIGRDADRPLPDRGCDICKKCWYIDELRRAVYGDGR